MRFIFVDLDQWPPRADVVESIVVVSTYHGTRSVVVTYKPSMLVPRARFPACALLQVDRFGAAVASGGALTVVSSSTWRDLAHQWPCGVTASTLDPESSNRGSNPRKAFVVLWFAACQCRASLSLSLSLTDASLARWRRRLIVRVNACKTSLVLSACIFRVPHTHT